MTLQENRIYYGSNFIRWTPSAAVALPVLMSGIRIRDLVEAIARLTGFEGKIVWDTTKPNGRPRRKLGTSRAEREFGFRAQMGFELAFRSSTLQTLVNTEVA